MKPFKWIGWLFGTILLGALGSGFWEKILSPVLTSSAAELVVFISRFSKSYQDSIYKIAARSMPNGGDARLVVFTILTILMMVFVVLSIPPLRKAFVTTFTITDTRRSIRIAMNVHAIVMLTMLGSVMFSSSKLSVAEGVASKILRSTEILRPVIGEQLYARYRADFYLMNDKHDFDLLKAKLDSEAHRYNLALPVDDVGDSE